VQFPRFLGSTTAFAILLSLFAVHTRNPAVGQLKYTGVNLAGAEFGASVLPGTYNTHYTYPTASEVNYFVGKGMNTFRLPFRWERLQRTQGGSLDATELARMDTFVNHATQLGANVILDPHNFARYYPDPNNYQSSATGLVGSAVPNSAFADFWSKVANHYKSNPRVMFNLMNEPNTMPTEQWVSAANSAISSIRGTQARNLILVPGNAWTGAWTWHNNWYGTPNAVAMLNITDPLDNYAFDVHQYLDSDGSGTSQNIVNQTIGSQRLAGFTQWLRTHGKRGFLGEWAVARQIVGTGASQIGDEAMLNLMEHVEANDDVWLGWAWWASGPWWGEYMFTLNPTSSGQDRPQMPYLEPHLVGLPVRSCDFNGDTICNLSDLNALLAEGPLAGGVPIFMSLTDHFDLDGNHVLNTSDVLAWLGEAAQRNGFSSSYRIGDANLDGVVDGSDFGLWNANKFTNKLGWDNGDFNADGVVDGTDFGLWNANRFLSSDRSSALVPEPATLWWGIVFSGFVFLRIRRK
jgi:endoglucanase